MLLKDLEKENAKKEALELSLEYKFVTPLTSMVVTKPQDEEMQVAHKPKEEEKPNRHSSGSTKICQIKLKKRVVGYLFIFL